MENNYTKNIPASHPGKYIKRILQDRKITAYRLAKDLGVSPTRIADIIKGERSVSIDTARRLSLYFGTSAQYWLNMQQGYDYQKHLSLFKDESYHIQPAPSIKHSVV